VTEVRRVIAAAVAALGVSVALAIPADADTTLPPPYIDHVEWAKWGDLSSLRVYPTDAGRAASSDYVSPDEAWAEVLTLSPDADIPGMQAQFNCHWHLAELAYPGKVSWNLEPWRPEVDDNEMVSTDCNPGGTEEPF
jgi:Protein of unknown function (DUF2599)